MKRRLLFKMILFFAGVMPLPANEFVTDIDGNTYKTVKIGNQVWMAENLKVTKYRDGTAIIHMTGNGHWTSTSSGAYCYYNNDAGHGEIYGALYNWSAVNDSRNIAPEGWHVPTDAEWKELEIFLGMSLKDADKMRGRGKNEGKKLKSTSRWNIHDTGTDEVAFHGLPSGNRDYSDGTFGTMGSGCYFWSASEYDMSAAWSRLLYYYFGDIIRGVGNKHYGFSLRLVQD